MAKTTLTTEDISNIIKDYQTTIISVEKLALTHHVGKKRVEKILLDNNIPRRKRGAQVKNGDSALIEKSKTNIYSKDRGDKKLVAVCKQSNITFEDINNLSGALTRHILSTYGEVLIPSNTYQRKKYEKEHGKKWFEEYFDIKEVGKPPTRECKMCDWVTEDVTNKTGCFEQHIKSDHLIDLKAYIKAYPEEIKYHPTYEKKIVRNEILTDINKSVVCGICGEKMFVISNTHLNKHNISGYEYKLKYSGKLMNDILIAKTTERLSTYNLLDNVKRKQTKPELEIIDLLNIWGIEHTTSNRSILNGKEIDILIDDIKLGIEYNGNIHHTEFFGGKGRQYHLNKTVGANNKGYKLIHVFSDEWLNKKDIVINKLSYLLGHFNGIKLGARKCVIKEITTGLKNEFLNAYHIQGSDSSTIKIGAFFEDILVGVMTFTNKNNGQYDLSRFATNYFYNISGLGSKLLSHFIKNNNPNKIISFADRRWTLDVNNNIYDKMGFKLVGVLKPDYKYYHPNNHKELREHKFGFRKQLLVKKYPEKLNMGLTELEMIRTLGYDRIWDCGLFKYEMNLEKGTKIL
jgi:hypothetical protein